MGLHAWHHDENGKQSSTRALTFMFSLLYAAVAIGDVWFDKEVGSEPYGTLQTILVILVTAVTARGVAKTMKGDPDSDSC